MKLTLKISTQIFLICFLFQNSYSQQNKNGWYWIDGQPQSQTLNWIRIIDATHYYAVGEQGVFMKSSDGGDTWVINSEAGVLDPSFESGATLRLYSGWFFNANTGYVAGQSVSGDGGIIRRTTDAGETFTDINLGLSSGLSRVSDIYFINSTTGYLCGNNTVKAMITTDAGFSWTELPNLPGSSYDYSCVYAKDANNILLGTNSAGVQRKIVRTTDGGASWSEDNLPGSTIVDVKDIVFQNANTGFVSGNSVAGNAAYVAYTVNGGASWIQSVFPNPVRGIYTLQVVGSTVYAGCSDYSYYYSSNLGITWDSVQFNDFSNPTQPYIGIVYSFNINGSDVIVAGLNGKINVSNDGGASWRNKNYAVLSTSVPYSTVFALRGTSKVWAGANGGGYIIYSSNAGTNWTVQTTGAPNAIYDIDMENASTGYATGGNAFSGTGYCYKTINGGVSWTALTIPTPSYQMNTADFIDVNTGWIVGGLPFGSGSEISKTTNGGLTWTSQVTTPVYSSAFGQIAMADANTGYLSSGTNVWKTTNGGTNWNTLILTPTISVNKIQIFSANNVYFGGDNKVLKTTNGGVNYSFVTVPPTTMSCFDMDWWDMNNGTYVGTQGYTAKTSDGGITWAERNTGTSTCWGVSMPSKDTVYTVCSINVNDAILRLTDAPATISLNLKVGIQGLWNGTTQVADTVKCHLRSSVSPYSEIGVAAAVVNSSGNGTFTFSAVPSGSYYIEVTQRNSIETWSKLPQAFVLGGSYNYDFTTSAAQAYGNNLVLKSGRYCDYSGDVNQDGFVNLTDVISTFNASSVFTSGYAVTDINGDLIVDLSDITIAFNNSNIFVQKSTP
jgi:photosystem II stability/assembly factor-like uncharacterized protein